MFSKSKLTTHLEKILNPEWNQVYAFSKDLIRASLLVITLIDKDDYCMDQVEFEVKTQFSLSKLMGETSGGFLSKPIGKLNWRLQIWG